MVSAEQVTDPIAFHAEGAVWSNAWGGLKWVDMMRGDVLTLGADGSVDRMPTGSTVAAMVRPRVDGGFVVVTEREFTLWDADGRREWAGEPLWEASAGIRFNEGGCDPEGRLLCGSMSYEQTPGAGTVWRFDAERTAERVFGDVTISNGLGFTGDDSRMYYVDSRTRRIDVFDYVDGVLLDRRPFVHVEEGAGDPDGLWVDAEDGVWVALYGGSAVHHYDASGTLTDVVELPVSKITSCTFGGPDLSTLYITTSREGLADDEQPLAGSVFAAPAGVRGTVVRPFAG
ncbi:SMP-30/gluconolactonase/LRE family protein [Herbiconiux sp. CPCC 205763]|uniref:SMP-30/gluconolactonase/LRE family protein n=1 Tax=Herbiconiux aconitum TaxID=2970913 RepID=A0ABT2GP31_9MICO|nr:SMP-30/gluconolactonase/LRE family protein [Herbiconiux aconitum]MCS5717980.1 SMP-30/gluconolactonase/LRE family protein [Herbiconiux aconitum]